MKLNSIYSLLCFNNKSIVTTFSVYTFLYSKYIEWFDTLFLVLSNRKISWLQYTHHMSTAILVYLNIYPFISPFISVFIILNCFVHILMYWYFAYPKGYLRKWRSYITKLQIIQHILCLITIISVNFISNCSQNIYGLILGFFLYSVYLIFFLHFYLTKK